LKLFNSIATLLLFCSVVSAQQADTTKTKQKKKDYRPTGIRFGTDALALVRNSYDKTFKGWEVNADADLDRYYVAIDYGYWAREFVSTDVQYTNDGTYFRVGVDVNFLTKDPEKNMFFIGGRYGRAVFSERLVVGPSKVDPMWGPLGKTSTNDNINGRWFELTTGIRVKMWKMMWMGYTARFKFALSTNEPGEMLPHDVPGFGRTDEESVWGFNYQIFVMIPVRKQK
jgi:hypothetical protein